MKSRNLFALALLTVFSSVNVVSAAEAPIIEENIESCMYSIMLDRNTIDFGDVESPTVRYVKLTNNSISNGTRDCSVKINQIALTHKNQGYGTEAYTFEVLGNTLDDSMLAVNETVEIKLTMTPDYTDGIEKYFVTALWIQALGYSDDNSKLWLRTTSRLLTHEVPENQRQCNYAMEFDSPVYSFGTIKDGDTNTKHAFLTNTGTCGLKLLHQSIVGAEKFGYSINDIDGVPTQPYTTTLLAGAKIDYQVSFTPSYEDMVGTYNNTMIYANALFLDPTGETIRPFSFINTVSRLNGQLELAK